MESYPPMKIADQGPEIASLRALIDSLPALIHTGRPDGYLDFFNQRWLDFVGLGNVRFAVEN